MISGKNNTFVIKICSLKGKLIKTQPNILIFLLKRSQSDVSIYLFSQIIFSNNIQNIFSNNTHKQFSQIFISNNFLK